MTLKLYKPYSLLVYISPIPENVDYSVEQVLECFLTCKSDIGVEVGHSKRFPRPYLRHYGGRFMWEIRVHMTADQTVEEALAVLQEDLTKCRWTIAGNWK